MALRIVWAPLASYTRCLERYAMSFNDLLFYRPGQKLSDRSLKLCENVRELGLKVETYVATWPLDGYGTKNVVTGDEMRAACPPK